MKRRARKVLNFFAFNLLFFALYLNFIHKDKSGVESVPVQTNTNAISGTILVQNPEKYLEHKNDATQSTQQTSHKEENSSALKLSIN